VCVSGKRILVTVIGIVLNVNLGERRNNNRLDGGAVKNYTNKRQIVYFNVSIVRTPVVLKSSRETATRERES